MTSPPIVEARGAARTLPGPVPAVLVHDIDLAIRPGEFVAVTGPSGSGKSSLLYLLGLLDRPSVGQILVDGRDTADLDDDALAGLRLARLGFVFQFHFLLPEFTVTENMLIPMRRLARLSDTAMAARARDLAERLDLRDCADRRPGQLSGGQRQRAAIARALANDPALVLADEPTGNLDTRNAANVFDIFAALVEDGRRAVAVVTHDVDLAARAARRVHLVDGVVVSDESRS